MKCARCGSPRATNHWELTACADGGKRRSKYLCDHHDAELNEIAMTFLGIRDAQKKASAYRGASLAAQPAAGEICASCDRPTREAGASIGLSPVEMCSCATLTYPAAQRPGAGADSAALALAKRMYNASTDSDTIHCNRFPSWAELSEKTRKEWYAKAEAKLSQPASGEPQP